MPTVETLKAPPKMQPKNFLLAFAGINKIKNAAATPNAITSPSSDTYIHAGQSMEVTWDEPSGNTVDLVLMKGDPLQLETVSTVAEAVPNQGSVAWSLPDDLNCGKYSLRISSDNGLTNYSPFFTVLDPVSPRDFGVGKNKVVRRGGATRRRQH